MDDKLAGRDCGKIGDPLPNLVGEPAALGKSTTRNDAKQKVTRWVS